MTPDITHDVAVIGDGPAGSALASRLTVRGADTVLIGRDDPWHATYGTWTDDIEAIDWLAASDVWSHRFETIAVDVGGPRTIDRPYGVVDNERLRATLREPVQHVTATVGRIDTSASGDSIVALADGSSIRSRLVVDATGWPGMNAAKSAEDAKRAVARQTAFGVVLAEPPTGPLGSAMLMDFSSPGGLTDSLTSPTFAYALPVSDGWLVEETVLAARPSVPPARLAGRLAARLETSEAELRDRAVRIEHVDIPMGGRIPDRRSTLLAFGAAAGMIHPATGYSLASALIRADDFAASIRTQMDAVNLDRAALWAALWPTSARRTRVLHDYGLDVLLDLDIDATRMFFNTFFDLDQPEWARYLRITTAPTDLAKTMTKMFAAAPWRLRRRLVSQNPLAFARLVRP